MYTTTMTKSTIDQGLEFKRPVVKTLSYEEYNERVKKLRTASDVTSFVKDLVAPTIQAML